MLTETPLQAVADELVEQMGLQVCRSGVWAQAAWPAVLLGGLGKPCHLVWEMAHRQMAVASAAVVAEGAAAGAADAEGAWGACEILVEEVQGAVDAFVEGHHQGVGEGGGALGEA